MSYKVNTTVELRTASGAKAGQIPAGTVVEVGTQVRYIREKDHVEILGGKYDGLWIEPKYLDVIGEPPPDDDPPPDGETVTWPSKTMQLRNTVTGEVYQNEDPVILTRSNG